MVATFCRRWYRAATVAGMLWLASVAQAQTPVAAPPTGAMAGTITAQQGAFALPGADIVVHDAGEQLVSAAVSGESGRFSIAGLAPGRYRVEARLEGFRSTAVDVRVDAGQSIEVAIDLPLAPIEQVVYVTIGPGGGGFDPQAVSRPQSIDARTIDEVEGIAGAMRLMAGVFQTPAGLSIRGGRPSQSGLLLGSADVADPSAGGGPFRLPADAVASIAVFPNPLAVEFGRFSTGVAVLGTRAGTDTWKSRLNNFIPSLRTERRRLFDVIGIERFAPRYSVSGPLAGTRVSLAQSVEYRYEDLTPWSRPTTDVMRGRALNTFTRIDGRVADGHQVGLSLTALGHSASAVNMTAFTPPEAAATIRERGGTLVATDAIVLSPTMLLESVVHLSRYTQRASPAGDNSLGLTLAPEANSGRFFEHTNRDTFSVQWQEALSKTVAHASGAHVFKMGVDALHSTLHGTVVSAPVTVRRVDGTVARRHTFSGLATQSVTQSDVALFAQDRWQVATRVRLEGGARLDRDGLLARVHPSARLGGVVVLGARGTAVVRAGYGRFFDRTPLLVGAFTQLDVATETRFAADGITALAAPQRLTPRVDGPLQTPRSEMWNVGVEQQLLGRLTWQANYFSRTGRHEFVVAPSDVGPARGLALSSGGRSVYRDLELSTEYESPGGKVGVRAAYTRAHAEGNTNAYLAMFGMLRTPIIPDDRDTASGVDVPHRVVARVRYAPSSRWLIAPVIEYRSGLPYLPVDEYLDVSSIDPLPRFPSVALVDIRVDRLVRVLKWRPWVGLSVTNAFNASDPTDVQLNTTSSAFGTFSGSRPRQFRLLMRFN